MYMTTADHLAYGLARLAAVARHESWRAGEEQGLTPTQFDILDLLFRRPEGVRVGHLAEQLQLTQPTVSDAIGALERKDLLRRYPDPADARARILRLTRSGKRSAAEARQPFEAVVHAMTAEDRSAMLEIVVRTITALVNKGAIAPQRICFTCAFFRRDVHPRSRRPYHCAYIDAPLGAADLRTDCPDHRDLDAA